MSSTTNTTVSSIAKLKERVIFRQGLARSNRFVVDFSATAPLFDNSYNINIADFDDLNYFCETTSLPGRTINTVEYSSWRNEIKIPVGYINDDVEMSFNLTNDYFIKELLDTWSNLVINTETYLLNYDKSYRADIKIYQLDHTDKITYGVILKGAYPFSVKAVELDNSSEGIISKCSASFAYKDFETINNLKPITPSALSSFINQNQNAARRSPDLVPPKNESFLSAFNNI